MTNQWLEAFLFPEKQAIEKVFFSVDWEQVHKELQKKNVTLTLLHHKYETEAREGGKLPYVVTDTLYWQEIDGIRCPYLDGVNDQNNREVVSFPNSPLNY